MVRLKDVKTGEEVELDLNNINIFNPMEREWDIIEGEAIIRGYIFKIFLNQGLHIKHNPEDLQLDPKIKSDKITYFYQI